ncbi:hypothetical protein AAMO2058_001749100 [Amorphochlora amoebiformis]
MIYGRNSDRSGLTLSLGLNVALSVALVGLSAVKTGATKGSNLGQASPSRCRATGVDVARPRRGFLSNAAAALAIPAAVSMVQPRESRALKFPGEKPKDLGVRADGSLKDCPSATSNCWSTFASDDKHLSQPLMFAKSRDEAIQDVESVLMSYPQTGQKIDANNLVDGGGWRMLKNEGGYFQLEFESKKFGFVDDVELYVQDGVNAYRLNFIADGLRKKGWTTPGFPLTTIAQR